MAGSRGRLWWTIGALALLAACGGKSPTPEQPRAANPSAGAPSAPPPNNPAPSTPSPSAPSGSQSPSQPAPQPQTPSPSHGPDDTPILISDGSFSIALNPLGGGKGGTGKQFSFSNFDRQPGDMNEIREIGLLNLFDGTKLTWDGIDINGVAPQTCQNPAEDCLIQMQYEGPGMDLEVAWNASQQQYNGGRKLVIRFPGRPVNQWIDWVRESHIIYHPVDWDHAARKRITQLFLNRTAQPVDPNGNRITIHLKPEPR